MKKMLELFKTRRSCRKYQDKQISMEELEAVLEAGIHAPSARNGQSAIIVVVQDKETLSKLSKWNAAVMGSDKDTFYGAPTLLVVLTPKSNAHGVADGACIMENLMMAAHTLGLGSCWIDRAEEVFNSEEGKQQLKDWGIEGEYQGIGNCILGYWDMPIPAPAPRKGNVIYKI